MDKKNYNLEIFFESLKKSFCIFSKNSVTFEEVRQKTIKEFKIAKEFEKDMRFTINIHNRQITLFNDIQILNNFEEMTKNYYYLKIFFNINNNNYIYDSSNNQKKKDINIRPYTSNQFSIISNNNNKANNKNLEKKYIDEINKLKEELEKVKNEKYNKAEFDIRKFDEKYRDLSNKNNLLEQKITELENENKTLKIGKMNKKISNENISIENKIDNGNLKEIENIFSRLMGEHENNIMREINGLKNKIDIMQKDQKKFYANHKNIDIKYSINNNKDDKDDNDDNFELFKDDKIIHSQRDNIEDNNIFKSEQNLINIDKKKENNKLNNLNLDDNFDILDNLDNMSEDNKNIKIEYNEDKDDDKEPVSNNMNNAKIKRNINYYDEDEKNSKSFDISKNKIKINQNQGNEKNDIIKEIKNSFLENKKNNFIIKKNSNYMNTEQNYSKYTGPSQNDIVDKMKIKNQKHIFNYTNINKDISDEELINYDSSSDINTDIKKLKDKNMVNSSNSQKNFLVKIDDKKRNGINNINNFVYNGVTPGGDGINIMEQKKNSFKKNDNSITPTGKDSVKENIENYFINIFQNIFFYGNNGYTNMLKISDTLLKKLRDGVLKFRLNMNDVKDYCIKYLSFTIVPIVNDSNTKEYQRQIIKNKISTVLETFKIDRNYFEKEYKVKEDKNEKNSENRNLNGVNVTYAKINEFRKLYELKEKDYPDEKIINALIKYRGNKEMAFQYLFY